MSPRKKVSPAEIQARLDALDSAAGADALAPVVAELEPDSIDSPFDPLVPTAQTVTLNAPLPVESAEVRVPVPPAVLRVTRAFPYRRANVLCEAKVGQLLHRDRFPEDIWAGILKRRSDCVVDATPIARPVGGA